MKSLTYMRLAQEYEKQKTETPSGLIKAAIVTNFNDDVLNP